MNIDFISDLKDFAIRQLEQHHVAHDKNATAHYLLMRLNLFYSQYIFPTPRKVLVSSMIESMDIPPQTQEALEKTIVWLEKGVDVNPLQSRNLRKWMKKKSEKDWQYALYGTRHLHLSAKKEDELPKVDKDGYAKNADYLLIAFFEDDVACLIDIIPHPQTGKNPELWTTQEIFRIMEKDFYHLVERLKLPDVTKLAESIDDKALNQLTYNGFSTMIETENGVYMPPAMGVASSGDSAAIVRDTDHEFNKARILQEWLKANYYVFTNEFSDSFYKINGFRIKEFDFHYEYSFIEKQFVILDRISGCYLVPEKNKLFIINYAEI